VLTGPFLRVTFANFFFFLNFASFFLLPLFVKELGGGEVEIGMVMGTTGFASLLSMLWVGRLIDRYGSRSFFLFGATGMTVAALLFRSVDVIGPWLLLLRVFQGVCFACAFTATTSLAAQLASREQRARALGLFGLSTILTHAIAPGIGEEIIRRYSFDALFAVAAGCTVLAIAIALGFGERSAAQAHASRGASIPLSRAQWVVAAATVLAGMGFGTVMTFAASYVRVEGFGRVGVFFAAYTSTAILTRFVGAGLSDRFGRRAIVVPALIVLGSAILMIALAGSTMGLAVAGLFFGAAQGISYPTMHALIVDLSSESQLGRVQALFNGAFNLGVTIGSFGFGPIAYAFGYRVMFAVLAATPMFAAAILQVALPRHLAAPRPLRQVTDEAV